MDFVSPILDVACRLWNFTSKHAAYMCDLQESVTSLRSEMAELKSAAEVVKNKAERAEENREMTRTEQVVGWLHSVENLEKGVVDILQEGDQEIQQKCLGNYCPKNCWSSYKIGKKASKNLGAVTDLMGKGRLINDVAYRLPRAPVDDIWMRETVGLDSMYADVCKCIQDEKLGIIGLYGMGGVGKTTLMTKVNNEFIKTSKDFEVVIWVDVSNSRVSNSPSVGNVQEVIRNKLDIPDEKWRNRSAAEKAVEILNVLNSKRFVMLLDDVWERLDLKNVGVPFPDIRNKSKVILTARSNKVCTDMEAHTSILVKCLNDDDATTLFKNRIRANTLEADLDIPKLAEIVAKECKGLPLALVTIGPAMADKNRREDWLQAIEKLRTHPSKIPGMENNLFSCLKLSYDNLENEITKSCFLYLALFREDYKIVDDHLINLWIGEGFLDKCKNLPEARERGYGIIEQLKTACLFESYGDRQVKMHDSIRDMALWLASSSKNKILVVEDDTFEASSSKNKILVVEDDTFEASSSKNEIFSSSKNEILVVEDDTLESQQVSEGQETQRMSLWSDGMEDLILPSYPNLVTLIVKNEVLYSFCSTKLCHLKPPPIKVLDLSCTSIRKLPDDFGKLVTLQYLDLSNTDLQELSTELKTLTRLKFLILDDLPCLRISKEVISNLSSLKLFSMQVRSPDDKENRFGYSWDYQIQEDLQISEDSNHALLEELEGLEHINDVCFSIKSAPSFQKFMGSRKLQNHIRSLGFGNLEDMASLQLPRMEYVHELIIWKCEKLKNIEVDLKEERKWEFLANYNISNLNFRSLRRVFLCLLPQLLNLTWLIYLPSVEVLEIIKCWSIEEVIRDSGVSQDLGIFSTLRVLRLDSLPKLKSICRQALPFPCLTHLWVSDCLYLTKLPLNSNSATNSLKAIRGNPEWWNWLKWEDVTLKPIFDPFFVNIYEENE